MTCHRIGPDLIVCATGEFLSRRILWCRSCCARRRHIVADPSSLWYASTSTCCTCGLESSTDGGARQTKAQRVCAATEARAAWSTAATAEQRRAFIRALWDGEAQP